MIRWRNRGNKYGAVKTVVDGITFDSKAEARRYQELRLLQRAGKIGGLTVHPSYSIRFEVNGPVVCNVILDFCYVDYATHTCIFEDVKGRDNALSRLKRKLVEAQNGIKVDVISANTRLKKH